MPDRPEAEAHSFASLEVSRGEGAGMGGLEIVIGDTTIRVGNDVAPSPLTTAIRAVPAA